MKKQFIFIFLLFYSIFIFAGSTKKQINNEPTIKFEKNTYSIKGKYHKFIWHNEDYLKILLKHPLVYNSKYNLLSSSNFRDFVSFNYREWNLQQGNTIFRMGTVNYYYYDKSSESLEISPDMNVIIGDYEHEINEKCVTREEWNDFILFLKEIKYKDFFLTNDFIIMLQNKNITVEDWVSEQIYHSRENYRLSMSNVVDLCLFALIPSLDINPLPLFQGDIIYFERRVNNNWIVSDMKIEDGYKIYLIEYSNIKFFLLVDDNQELSLIESNGVTYVWQNVKMQYLNNDTPYYVANGEHRTLLFKYVSNSKK